LFNIKFLSFEAARSLGIETDNYTLQDCSYKWIWYHGTDLLSRANWDNRFLWHFDALKVYWRYTL